MSLQNKELDKLTFGTFWCVIGFVVMGAAALIIDVKTHSNIEYCLTPEYGCKVWVRGVDTVACKIITEQLNKTRDKTLYSFYMCR